MTNQDVIHREKCKNISTRFLTTLPFLLTLQKRNFASMMRQFIACILTVIYLGFTAGAVAFETSDLESHFAGKGVYGYDINASNEDASDGSHVEDINLHKVHKHLAASRTLKVPGVNFSAASAPIYVFRADNFYKKGSVNTVTSEPVQTDIFIKNRVLRI